MPECRIVGTSLEEFDDEQFPSSPAGLRGVRPARHRRGPLARVPRQAPLRLPGPGPGGPGRRGVAGRRVLERGDPPAALPEHPPAAAEAVVQTLGRGRPGRPGPDHHGEAVRHRSGQRPGPQRAGPRGLRRGPGLPHRPLPRQGSGAEHPGLPLRQRPVRAHLEPRPHRPRPDRRARDALGGRPGRASTRPPARSATWSSPTCSRSWPSWPWSRRPRSSPGPSARRRTRSSAPCGPST